MSDLKDLWARGSMDAKLKMHHDKMVQHSYDEYISKGCIAWISDKVPTIGPSEAEIPMWSLTPLHIMGNTPINILQEGKLHALVARVGGSLAPADNGYDDTFQHNGQSFRCICEQCGNEYRTRRDMYRELELMLHQLPV